MRSEKCERKYEIGFVAPKQAGSMLTQRARLDAIQNGNYKMKTRLKFNITKLIAFALILFLLPFGSAVAGRLAEPPTPAGKDWPNYGGDYYNRRYSALNQINTSNVKNLKGAWTFHVKYG